MSKRSDQDWYMGERGFRGIEVCEYPEWTDRDRRLMNNLDREVRNSTDQLLKAALDFAPSSFISIQIRIDRFLSEFERFAAERAELIPEDWPDAEFFRKVKLIAQYEGMIDFIVRDGGEIREGDAYEDDGETVKAGWSILYWK